jgi:hypothetical protein
LDAVTTISTATSEPTKLNEVAAAAAALSTIGAGNVAIAPNEATAAAIQTAIAAAAASTSPVAAAIVIDPAIKQQQQAEKDERDLRKESTEDYDEDYDEEKPIDKSPGLFFEYYFKN